MSKIQIDADALTAALAQALPIAIKTAIDAATQKAMDNMSPLVIDLDEDKVKKKRGRPKTIKKLHGRKVIEVPLEQTEIISVEEEDLSVLNEPEEPVKRNKPSYFFNAKSKQTPDGDKKYSQVEEIDGKNRNIKFVDVAGVKHEKQDWEPTERRNPVQKMKFNCTKCTRDFFEYPSNVPQAFFKVSGSTEGVHQNSALIVCPDCNTKGGTGGRKIG